MSAGQVKAPVVHTALPWFAAIPNDATFESRKNRPEVVDAHGETIAVCEDVLAGRPGYVPSTIKGSGAANAAFIVRAVNAHAELVEAIGRMLRSSRPASGRCAPSDEAIKQAEAILAKLSGESFSLEFRAEVGKWELMQGGAHRGLYDSESAANAARAKFSGGAA